MLDKLAHKYLTDKRTGKHGYTVFYEDHFKHLKDNHIKLLEIGVREARSLNMWADYFPNATIYGIDVNQACKKYETDRIKIFIGNQANKNFLEDIIKEIGDVDIIIDDGSHRNSHQKISLDVLYPYLKEEGFYVIEDLHSSYSGKYNYGGGYKLDYSTIEYLKHLIDIMNYPFHMQCINDYIYKIKSFHFYSGICFINKAKADNVFRPEDVLIRLISDYGFKKIAEIGATNGKMTRKVLDSLCKNIITEYIAVGNWGDNKKYYLWFCGAMKWAKSLRVFDTAVENPLELFGEGYFDLIYLRDEDESKVNGKIRKGGMLLIERNRKLETKVIA